ncbi:MAG: hypothetical protein L0H25_00700 [Micrococcales bacterium]|nr:hypothetical protein [Micrococcales bacterium]
MDGTGAVSNSLKAAGAVEPVPSGGGVGLERAPEADGPSLAAPVADVCGEPAEVT